MAGNGAFLVCYITPKTLNSKPKNNEKRKTGNPNTSLGVEMKGSEYQGLCGKKKAGVSRPKHSQPQDKTYRRPRLLLKRDGLMSCAV